MVLRFRVPGAAAAVHEQDERRAEDRVAFDRRMDRIWAERPRLAFAIDIIVRRLMQTHGLEAERD